MLVTPIGVSAKIWVASGSGDSNLYVIDETGATIETVGDTGEYFTGLAYSVGERVLYGTTSGNSNTLSSVFRIDPATAQATLLGAHGVDTAIIDLSFSPDSVLYGWAEPGVDDLVTIDLGTGAATQLANPDGSAGRTIEFTPDGNIALFNLSSAKPLALSPLKTPSRQSWAGRSSMRATRSPTCRSLRETNTASDWTASGHNRAMASCQIEPRKLR